ncbi:hypothetical protein [Synechocystis sp. PCC 7509]|uniref:hypothetical protein n=1 Tax=Synechocystis sp. PCC 7509 TaxID=927677 RepID=UPI0002AC4A67|nr:hypothetical protein [Synechocystis sp. PCC 7509]
MKLNSTAILTLVLLTLMVGSGYLSSVLAYGIGHEALKSVTKPDARPATKIKVRKPTSQKEGSVVMLKEQDILNTVKARISGKGKKVRPQKVRTTQSNNSVAPKAQLVAATETPQAGFPISNTNQDVTLSVTSARYSGGALVLKLDFKNKGDKTVRFLYSFMDVTDDRGRALSANTEGLPEELPPDGNNTGTISIPTALLDDVKSLSLQLTDYPDQQLQLFVANIPVVASTR